MLLARLHFTLLLLAAAAAAAPLKPMYVGAKACAKCHATPETGNQYSTWLLSKHARAFATLTNPESWTMARLSGLRLPPWQEPVCLGCHSTASAAQDWEKEDDFRIEDGLQCESCHGPGSEYMSEEVMKNRALAMKAGLKMPNQDFCMGCHIAKASHDSVIRWPAFDYAKASAAIAHPVTRLESSPGRARTSAAPGSGNGPGPSYIGSAACGKCHQGERFGHQYNVWRQSPHAGAYAVLATPRASQIARQRGLSGDAQAEPACLACHATGGANPAAKASFAPEEGVGCEACHGPGSEYSAEAVMRNRTAAIQAGLRLSSQADCIQCHKGSAAKPFDAKKSWTTIAHASKLPPRPPPLRYKTPLNLALRPKSRELWVTCSGTDSVAVVDLPGRRKVAEIPVGGEPHDVAFTPDGARAFVSNCHDDTVSVIDTARRAVIATLNVGDEPHGLLTDAQGKYLYVLNTSSNDITVFALPQLEFVKTLAAGRGPYSLALSPTGDRILSTSMYSHLTGFRQPFRSEVSVIETGRGRVEDRWVVPEANLMMGVAWHPAGEYALATLNRTKSLIPMTRLLQGWTITNGLAVLWNDGGVDQVLLDQPGRGFADATDVAFTPNGRYALVTSAGTDQVAVVDTARLISLIRRGDAQWRRNVLPNHLGQASHVVSRFIETGLSPRGIAVSPDGATAYVASALDDSVSILNLRSMTAGESIPLGGPEEITKERWGERLFHSARITFRRQFSCASCHPDGHVDSVTYDLEADGIGVSPVDNRTLRGINDTAPFKWEGTNPSLARQCGARLSVFFTRNLPFTPEELSAVDLYVTTIARPPNRYWRPGDKLTPAQRRGKLLFEREYTMDGREIPAANRCITCHPPPYFTNRKRADVGSRQALDRQGEFDTPHLNNIYDSAPYLHNGMAATLEEIWTVYNPHDTHGVTNDLTKDQLNDLIEYLKTL